MLRNLWRDDRGAVIATEYLLLGTIVALGAAAGMSEMADTLNEEMQEFGAAVRSVRQAYRQPPIPRSVRSRSVAPTHTCPLPDESLLQTP